ncbi:MAG: hypothetical protein V1827_03375 [Candidatus Micrarchaeota archaeon]
MGTCFMCGNEADTRKVFVGAARGFSEICIDCVIRFYKIKTEP